MTDSFVFTGENNAVEETLILLGNVVCGQDGVTVENDGVKIKIIPVSPCAVGAPEEYTEDKQITDRWGNRLFRVKLTFTGGRNLTAGYTIE